MFGKYMKRVLIVEDDHMLGLTLCDTLHRHGLESRLSHTVQEARINLTQYPPLWFPDLLLLDVSLPDGSAFDLLHDLRSRSPRPLVVAISGKVCPKECFDLALLGVQRFLPKPLDLDVLESTLRDVSAQIPDVDTHLRLLVGKLSLHDMENQVRVTMVAEALARGRSMRGAARLLSISRQLLQHILRKEDNF